MTKCHYIIMLGVRNAPTSRHSKNLFPPHLPHLSHTLPLP